MTEKPTPTRTEPREVYELRQLKASQPDLADAPPGGRCQLERQGYFCVDPDSSGQGIILNRTVTLRDSWARQSG